MKLISRSALGVIIGSLNVLMYIGLTIYTIIAQLAINASFREADEHFGHPHKASGIFDAFFIIFIIVFIIMIAISLLLIFGIVKRRHNLMLPWLILSSIGFFGGCLNLIGHMGSGHFVVGYFFSTLIGLIISGIILYQIFSLFRDIRQNNITGGVSGVHHYQSH